jgi:hypothetical protein
MCHAKFVVSICCSLQEDPCFLGRSTHNQGSIPCGKQHQTSLVEKLAKIGIKIEFSRHTISV